MNHRTISPKKLAGFPFLLAVLMAAVPQSAQADCSYCGDIPCVTIEYSETEIVEELDETCETGSDGIRRCVTVTTYTLIVTTWTEEDCSEQDDCYTECEDYEDDDNEYASPCLLQIYLGLV